MIKRSLLLLIFILSIIGIPTQAANFYAVGYEYQAPCYLLKLEGSISTARVIADDCGRAGVEQDITVITETGELMLEILNWYREGNVVVGITVRIKKDGGKWEYHFTEKVAAVEGTIYKYGVYLYSGNVHVTIHDGNKIVYQKVLRNEGARYIPRTSSYIEYWRDCDCSFYYYGWVTITNTKYINSNIADFYNKSQGIPFDIYFIHHTWKRSDGSIFYIDKGEIDDRDRGSNQ